MTAQTVHVVQAFQIERDYGVVAVPAKSYVSASAAKAAAEALADSHIGVLAWSRTLDPDVGEYGEPEEIWRSGTIPGWFGATGVPS